MLLFNEYAWWLASHRLLDHDGRFACFFRVSAGSSGGAACGEILVFRSSLKFFHLQHTHIKAQNKGRKTPHASSRQQGSATSTTGYKIIYKSDTRGGRGAKERWPRRQGTRTAYLALKTTTETPPPDKSTSPNPQGPQRGLANTTTSQLRLSLPCSYPDTRAHITRPPTHRTSNRYRFAVCALRTILVHGAKT